MRYLDFGRVRWNYNTSYSLNKGKGLNIFLVKRFASWQVELCFVWLDVFHNTQHIHLLGIICCCSVTQLCPTLCDLQHTKLLCPWPSPRACSNSCPLNWWCYPTISFSVIPFSSCPQSFPASESFPMSQFFVSGGQSIGASASASVLPMNIQDWFPLGLTGLTSLKSKGLSRVFSNTTVQKHQFFGAQLSL